MADDCPNTRLSKRGETDPVVGISLVSREAALARALEAARIAGEGEAKAWLEAQEGECPEGCDEILRHSVHPRRIEETRGLVVVWLIFPVPLPFVFYGWRARAVAVWKAKYVCADVDATSDTEREEDD